MQSIGASEFSLENLRKRLQDMSDEELIQFGKACRDMLTPQANLAGRHAKCSWCNYKKPEKNTAGGIRRLKISHMTSRSDNQSSPKSTAFLTKRRFAPYWKRPAG